MSATCSYFSKSEQVDNTMDITLGGNYAKQDIRTFLVRAKNNTYVAGENEVLPSRPNSYDFSTFHGGIIL